ncbi:MAG: ATP-binding protein [Bauldia sp.]|nr:ATP-binding protein [Bauldia sp.]
MEMSLAQIRQGESAEIEFKETLILDTKKHRLGGRPILECASPEVTLSTVKSIAGFANSGGGTLYVGVSDDGETPGLSDDYALLPGVLKNFDHWELYLRGKIEQLLLDGRSVSNLVKVDRVTVREGVEIARVTVGARRRLCIVCTAGVEYLYVRSGNRTISVRFSDLEGFFNIGRAG